jgi:hypothetical protein
MLIFEDLRKAQVRLGALKALKVLKGLEALDTPSATHLRHRIT